MGEFNEGPKKKATQSGDSGVPKKTPGQIQLEQERKRKVRQNLERIDRERFGEDMESDEFFEIAAKLSLEVDTLASLYQRNDPLADDAAEKLARMTDKELRVFQVLPILPTEGISTSTAELLESFKDLSQNQRKELLLTIPFISLSKKVEAPKDPFEATETE